MIKLSVHRMELSTVFWPDLSIPSGRYFFVESCMRRKESLLARWTDSELITTSKSYHATQGESSLVLEAQLACDFTEE
jgi:hypothetical protein